MIVVDTNILAYLWLPSRRQTDAAHLGRLEPVWSAPTLWRSEFRNVATGYIRAGKLSVGAALTATDRAGQCLIGGEFAVADALVFRLVQSSKCSAYDCEYAALAMEKGIKLVTEDRALLIAFPEICLSLSAAVQDLAP